MARYLRACALAVALVLVVTACGGDDDDTTAAGGGDNGGSADAELAAFCENAIAVETLGEPEIDWETASEEEIANASKAFAEEEILPLAQEIQATAPDEIADDVATLVAATEELSETGDYESAFETPEAQEADARFHATVVDECDVASVEVTLDDYEFQGIPDSLDAGVTSFDFTNEGEEFHELVLFRRVEGVTESWDEILEAEDDTKAEFVAGGFAPPGESDYATADLTPGEYIAVCFVPVGATPEAQQSGGEPEGPPHFMEGMRAEFTVE